MNSNRLIQSHLSQESLSNNYSLPILKNPSLSESVLARQQQYISKGFDSLDFPFTEIAPTFIDIVNAIKKQLDTIDALLKTEPPKEACLTEHFNYFKTVLLHCQNDLTTILDDVEKLKTGIFIHPQQTDKNINSESVIPFPYGKCIHLSARYAEVSDLLYRSIQRYKTFGPDKPFFKEALTHSNLKSIDNENYLTVLENQDYITAFHQVLDAQPKEESDKYIPLFLAKENNYCFKERTYLLRNIYKKMQIPFHFQSVRYKYHLVEDLLKLNIILFPTMKPLNIKNFLEYRSFKFFPLGISPNIIYADGYHLTASDFFYHDVKHTLDMMSRNFIAYFEQNYTQEKSANIQQLTKQMLDKQINDEIINMQLEAARIIDLKKAINAILFEMCHEEGYPYDYNALIRSLENPNPFYGEDLVLFLKKKLTLLNFFSIDKEKLPKELQFPIELLDTARSIILKSLCQLRIIAFTKGYQSDKEGHWEITRGKLQLNPYTSLKGEKDYENSDRQINNMYFIFKNKNPAPLVVESRSISPQM